LKGAVWRKTSQLGVGGERERHYIIASPEKRVFSQKGEKSDRGVFEQKSSRGCEENARTESDLVRKNLEMSTGKSDTERELWGEKGKGRGQTKVEKQTVRN